MTLLLLGATGRTGKWVLKEALLKGYGVHALVRDKSKIEPRNNLVVFEGSPINEQALAKASEGCNAVVSVLNISRTSDFPWAKLRTPNTFLSDTMRSLLRVTQEKGLKRLVVCSAWGVADTHAEIPWWFRWMIQNSNIGLAYADHQKQEQLIAESDLKWTIVRPVGLMNTKTIQKVRVSYGNTPKPRITIGRRSLAHFMVNALETPGLIGKYPVVSAE